MKRAQPEETEPDVLVQISMAVEGRFAVVQVKRAEVFHPHRFVKVVHCLFESVGFPEIISRSVDVTCVQTYADTFLVVYEGDDVAQVFEGGANYVAPTCHGFEDRRYGLGGCVGSVESFGYTGDGRGSRMAASPARVEIVKSDAERFAAVEIVQEGIVGLGGLFGVFLGEVDEVGAVRQDMTVRSDEKV